MPNLTLYIAQVNQIWEDKEANKKYLGDLFQNTDFQENGLLILPEMFNTGFSTNPERLAENWENSSSVNWLTEISNKFQIGIITSLIIQEGSAYYNRLVFVDKGNLLGYYNKNYLFSLAKENLKFTSGNEKHVFLFNEWRILPLICYDLRFPELSRIQTTNQEPHYDLLVYVANWPQKRISHWNKLLEARAIENLSYSVGVNRVGIDGNDIVYNGDSKVVNPLGEVVAQFQNGREGIFEVNIDSENVNQIRNQLGFLNDIK
ncbi:MAG: nitrilase family protein [Crocinitomicaceae bacterium]|nr:nitrilase family protein [Crocinitomicaceae bacterium]